MNSRNHRFALFATLIAAAGILAGPAAAADRGIQDNEILIGQCAALTGAAKGLGTGMNTGLKAAFDEANAKGGIYGRQIRLLADDDGYEPDKCVDCTGKMIEDKGVFALAGYVGTPTAKVAAPMVQEYKIPLVGLFTGAMLLRDPVQRYVINIRASYDDEAEALVEHLTQNRAFQKIAVFYQNDSFGFSVLSGVEKALTRRKLALVAKGSFERNTLERQSRIGGGDGGDAGCGGDRGALPTYRRVRARRAGSGPESAVRHHFVRWYREPDRRIGNSRGGHHDLAGGSLPDGWHAGSVA